MCDPILSEQVNWYHALREFWSIYRFNSVGGSKPIRSHKREVRILKRVVADLEWKHGYKRMPRGLQSKYAYAELLDPRGPVVIEKPE
mgnify:CR=1 FL=1